MTVDYLSQSAGGTWRPLPRVLYGFAIYPFVPDIDDFDELANVNQDQIPLEVGSELYIFEAFYPNVINGSTSTDQSVYEPLWYRGYVVADRRSAETTGTSSPIPNNDPVVTIGIFPANHTVIKDRLETEEEQSVREGILDTFANSQDHHLLLQQQQRNEARLAPLFEEEEERDAYGRLFGNANHRASVSSRKRVSVVHGTANSSRPITHAKTPKRSSLAVGDGMTDAMDLRDERPERPLPSMSASEDTAAGIDEPLVDEISCALREWAELLRKYLHRRDYTMFGLVKQRIAALHLGRRQLLSRNLSVEEVSNLRKDMVKLLVKGNLEQNLDVVVRQPASGALVNVEAYGNIDRKGWMSAIRMYRMQVELGYSSIVETNVSDAATCPSVLGHSELYLPSKHAERQSATSGVDRSSAISFHHVLLEMKAFFASPCSSGETVELAFSLYNRSENRFLTEDFCVILNHQGMPLNGQLDQVRTFFRDLSQQDVLDSLVIVCRVTISDNPAATANMARASSLGAASLAAPHLVSTFSTPSSTTINDFGRTATLASRGGLSTQDSAFRHDYRRPFGCAVVEISQLFKPSGVALSTPHELNMPIFIPVQESNFATLHEDIIMSRIREFDKSPRAEHITISLRVFQDDAKAVIRDNPSLLQGASQTLRLGFPDVVFPEDQRNDVYVKLWTGDFSATFGSSGKMSRVPANIEVEVALRNKEGDFLTDVLSRGSGLSQCTRVTSMVFRNNAQPTWGELVKVAVTLADVQTCHLFFSFRNRRERTNSSTPAQVNKPYAFTFLSLLDAQNSFLPDGNHKLVLYRYDSEWVSNATYLECPSITPVSGQLVVPPALVRYMTPLKDTLSIRTFLCSTRLTQDPILLQLLNWEKMSTKTKRALAEMVQRIRFCAEFECVKTITSLFDALFGIMASSYNDDGELDNSVFSAIVTLLGLVNDRRFKNFIPVLDAYILGHFSSSTASRHLLASLCRLVSNFDDAAQSQNHRAAIKVWGYLFKFIVRSRQLQRSKEEGMHVTANHLEEAFRAHVKTFLQDLNTMMTAVSPPFIIGTQTLAIQHFASVITELGHCFAESEVLDLAVSFCDSIDATRLSTGVQRVLLLTQLAGGPLLDSASARSAFVPNSVRWLKPHLSSYNELGLLSPREGEGADDATRISWLEGVRLSVSVIAILLDRLHAGLVNAAHKDDKASAIHDQDAIIFLLSLMPRLLSATEEIRSPPNLQAIQRYRSTSTLIATTPTVFPATSLSPLLVKSALASNAASTNLDHLVGEVAANIIALIHIALPSTLLTLFEDIIEVDGPLKCRSIVIQLLRLFTSITRGEIFPPTWLNIFALALRCGVRAAQAISAVIIRHYLPTRTQSSLFDNTLWKEYFGTLLTLLHSPLLAIEDFGSARQRIIWRLCGDLRGRGATILLRTWQSLSWASNDTAEAKMLYGGYQVGMTSLVEPVLGLCLSHHDELRNSAVNILFSLIISEYYLSDSFDTVENEVLERLDKLFSHKTGDEISRSFFITQLRTLFQTITAEPKLQARMEAFLDSIDNFLELLLNVRNMPEGEEWQDDRVVGTLKLMAFIEKRHRPIFIRYVHRLVDFHITAGQYTEAALTLKLHADLYTFDTTRSCPAMGEIGLPEQSEFSRKELLYLRMLENLSKGESFETAIAVSRVLQSQYEQHVFAYQRLSELLTHQADLFASIISVKRNYAEVFRVGFFGLGFPIGVQNKQFVYRAADGEKYGAFCERMHGRHPDAQLLRGSDVPDEELQQSDLKYLVITHVTPEPDKSIAMFSNPDVPSAVRSYYEHNETSTFSYKTQSERTDHALVDTARSLAKWTRIVYLECQEAFPTILRRTQVISTRVKEISPVEAALQDVSSKTNELESLYRQYSALSQRDHSVHKGRIDSQPMSMLLNSTVDIGMVNSIPQYRRAFFDHYYIASNTDKLALIESLRESMDTQICTIAKCLVLHESICPPDMEAFHAGLVRFFERNFAEEIARLPDLVYRLPIQLKAPSTASVSVLSHSIPGSPPQKGEASTLPTSKHARGLSNGSSVTTSVEPGPLPLALAPVPALTENGKRRHANSSGLSHLLKPPTNGVHFAPDVTPLSPNSPSTAPSVTSERPSSILSRFSSLRRKTKQ